MEEPDPETEDLLAVHRALDDGEAKVQRDRHRAHHGHDDAEAETGGHAVVVDVHAPFHGARIEEGHGPEVVVGHDRHLIFQAVEKQEIAADLEAIDHRADAAEFEAAQAAIAAGIKTLEDRRIGTGVADLAAGDEHVLAAAVGPLVERKVLVALQRDLVEGVVTQDLFNGALQQAAFRRQQKRVGRVPRNGAANACQEVLALGGNDVFGFEELHIMDADIFQADGRGGGPVLIEPAREAELAAQARLAVLIVNAVEVIDAGVEAKLAVEQVGLAEGERIALQLRAGHGFRPEFLTGAAEGMAAQEIVKTGRPARDIEVAFRQGDGPGQTGIGVDADAEDQAAGRLLFHVDQDVLELALAVGIDDRHRGPNA